MKLKIFIAAAAFALTSQASFAATDTSCNPFAKGENCNGQVSLGSFVDGASLGEVRIGKTRGHAVSFGLDAVATEQGLQRLGRMLRLLAKAIEGGNADYSPQAVVFVPKAADLFDGDLEFEVADNGEGQGVSVGDDLAVVPVPAAGFLLLAGLGGLVAMRRKKS